jgi:uncharacterized ion transporter superfamily protein YfcC
MNFEDWKVVMFYGFAVFCLAWGIFRSSTNYWALALLAVLNFALIITIALVSRMKNSKFCALSLTAKSRDNDYVYKGIFC